MEIEILEINQVKPVHAPSGLKLVLDCDMNDIMLKDNLAVICEQLGDDEFIEAVNCILGTHFEIVI